MANVELIKKRIEALEKEQEEASCLKEMLKGELEASEEYLKASEEVKAATQKRKQIKDEILSKFQPTIKELEEHKEEISTLCEILDAELKGYWVADPINNEQINTNKGIRRINISAKVAKTNQKSLFGGN